jgi:hypothetical protein
MLLSYAALRAHLPGPRALLCCCRFSTSSVAFPTSFPHGLTGVSATDAHYSTALDMSAPLLLRSSAQDFMGAARADAAAAGGVPVGEHLARASSACDAFLCSGTVHDREEVRRELLGVLKQEGQMALFMGGKSVGKSLLLRELARTPLVGKDGKPRTVVVVNGRRSGTDLAVGLVRALEKVTLEGSLGGALQGLERTAADRARNSMVLEGLREAVKVAVPALWAGVQLSSSAADAERLLDAMVSLARKEGTYLCLIIDEGNLALPSPLPKGEAQTGEGASVEEQRRQSSTKALLNRLVELTKESRSMNVLLATSEHAYPYRLRHNSFFNVTDLSLTILAGEVPPARMRELLRSWGLGPRLADVFLAYLGGHVLLASRALDRLAATQDDFSLLEVSPSLCAVGVDTCLQEGGSGARSLLQALAVSGWAPVAGPRDAAMQVLARENVGGFVDQGAVAVGLPKELRQGSSSGMGAVPSFHFMRHVIAQRLAVVGVGGGERGAQRAASLPSPYSFLKKFW